MTMLDGDFNLKQNKLPDDVYLIPQPQIKGFEEPKLTHELF